MRGSNISIILCIVILIVVVSYYISVQSKKKAIQNKLEEERLTREHQENERIRLEIEEQKRITEKAAVEAMFGDIQKSNSQFDALTTYKNGYFNNNKLAWWKASVTNLYNNLSRYKIETLKLDPILLSAGEQLKKNYADGEIIRNQYNKKYLEYELRECDDFFSNIEGRALDQQQRLAIIKDEDNNLVIAGAGSGKTTTVAGKVAYLINRFQVKPEEILLITFTKKASDEMKHRIKEKMKIDIEVNTFHSFGRRVIGEVTNDMPSVIEEKQFYTEMKNIFNVLFKDPIYASNVIQFITEYRLDPKDEDDFKSRGEYINYIKDNNIRSYKTVEVEIKGKPTILREYCKSLEEVQIANYLFLNAVNYKYEAFYKHKTSDNLYAQYKPDFYLPDYDIYIEHFGLIDKNDNVPNWFSSYNGMSAKKKYNTDIAWKRETHAKYGTTLVETYSYENKEGALLINLKEKLEQRGVVFRPRTNDEIWEILNSIAKDEISAFDTLIITFLNLFKSNNFQVEDIRRQINSYMKNNTRKRYLLFLDIFIPFLNKYNEFLTSKHLIDFSDMINEAAKHISNGGFRKKFKYIIVDEFQDTSMGRFKLINALLKDSKLCKLFAVGDDWQSIYRFAGSDISLFTQFEKYFGVTEFSKIETTYRFSKSMIDISSRFILANPNQTAKELKAFANEQSGAIEIIRSNSLETDDPFPLIAAINKINQENVPAGKKLKILALARYNHVIDYYKKRKDLFEVVYSNVNECFIIRYLLVPDLEVQFLSVHRSKGLEGDYAIILNCVSGQYGFPSEQADDPILNLFLSKADQFLNGEERRLFYVALTRAKRKTFITTNSSYESKFIKEIDPGSSAHSGDKCPVCKKGNKIKQEGINKYGKHYVKYTCSNWNFGCDYLAWGK